MVRAASFLLALAASALWVDAGYAQDSDWIVEKVIDGSFIFRTGNWSPLAVGNHFERDALLMTNSGGGMTLRGDGVRLTFGHQTRAQIFSRESESVSSLYQYAGVIGVHVEGDNHEVRIETPFSIIKAQKAAFAVDTGADASVVAVTAGYAGVFDLTSNAQVDVEAGKSVRAERTRPLSEAPPPPADFAIDSPEGLAALAILPDRNSSAASLADKIGSYDEGMANLKEAIAYFRSLPWQEQLAAGLGLAGVSLLAGLSLDYFLGVGIGMIGNSLVVMAGLAVGGYIRLRLLADLSWRDYDPGISIGLTFGVATLFLIVATMVRGNRQA